MYHKDDFRGRSWWEALEEYKGLYESPAIVEKKCQPVDVETLKSELATTKSDKEVLILLLKALDSSNMVTGIDKIKDKIERFSEEEIRKILIILKEIEVVKGDISVEDLTLTSERTKKAINKLQLIDSNLVNTFYSRGRNWGYI